MNRERGSRLSFNCAYGRRDSIIACLPNERALSEAAKCTTALLSRIRRR